MCTAAVKWIQCSIRQAFDTYSEQATAERLQSAFNERVKSDGIAALIKCGQNSANETAATACVQAVAASFNTYLSNVQSQAQSRSTSAANLSTSLTQCQTTFDSDMTESASIISTLRACIPQLTVY